MSVTFNGQAYWLSKGVLAGYPVENIKLHFFKIIKPYILYHILKLHQLLLQLLLLLYLNLQKILAISNLIFALNKIINISLFFE